MHPESQCGFHAERSILDMVCKEQQILLLIAFIDLTKAFDLVSRGGLFKLPQKISCAPTVLSLTKSFHTDMKGTVQFNGSTSVPFNIVRGVKQGCILAPTLFDIILLHDAEVCLWKCLGGHFPPYFLRWPTFQPCLAEGQDEDPQGFHQGLALCR